jgi:hypothetical protein
MVLGEVAGDLTAGTELWTQELGRGVAGLAPYGMLASGVCVAAEPHRNGISGVVAFPLETTVDTHFECVRSEGR